MQYILHANTIIQISYMILISFNDIMHDIYLVTCGAGSMCCGRAIWSLKLIVPIYLSAILCAGPENLVMHATRPRHLFDHTLKRFESASSFKSTSVIRNCETKTIMRSMVLGSKRKCHEAGSVDFLLSHTCTGSMLFGISSLTWCII